MSRRVTKFVLFTAVVVGVCCLNPKRLVAEIELSIYSGYQMALSGRASGDDPILGKFDFNVDWEGEHTPLSHSWPPYYAYRATWWLSEELGFGLEFNHSKAYSDQATLESNKLEVLEFSDGLNFLTGNVSRRWPLEDLPLAPYMRAGLGFAVPRVEFQATGGTLTDEYKITGLALTLVSGLSYGVSERWSVFGEYQGVYLQNSADLNGGGSLKANVISHAFNMGLSFSFSK